MRRVSRLLLLGACLASLCALAVATGQPGQSVERGAMLVQLPSGAVRSGPPPAPIRPAGPGQQPVTILVEGFDGLQFPPPGRGGAEWATFDNLARREMRTEEIMWDREECQTADGPGSAWAIGGGPVGSALACEEAYNNKVETFLLNGPHNLELADMGVRITFDVWADMPASSSLRIGASAENPNNILTLPLPGSPVTNGWRRNVSITIRESGGHSDVRVGFVYRDDAPNGLNKAAFIDNVRVEALFSGGETPQPTVTNTPILPPNYTPPTPTRTATSSSTPLPRDQVAYLPLNFSRQEARNVRRPPVMPTATKEPQVACVANVLQNGDFEAGPSGWTASRADIIQQTVRIGGEWSALFGGRDSAIDSLLQPSSPVGHFTSQELISATLSLRLGWDSQEPFDDVHSDVFVATLINRETNRRLSQPLIATSDEISSARSGTGRLSPLDIRGALIIQEGWPSSELIFQAQTNEQLPTTFLLDDVVLSICAMESSKWPPRPGTPLAPPGPALDLRPLTPDRWVDWWQASNGPARGRAGQAWQIERQP